MKNELREQFILLMAKCSKFNTTFPALCGLPLNEMGILHMISQTNADGCPEGINLDMQSIQERLQISRPAISYNLNVLEKKEYIVREIDQKDRRRISVHITQKGATAWELSLQQHEDRWNELVEAFGESEMAELTQLLSRFFEVFETMLESEEF